MAANADYLFTHDRGYLHDAPNRHGVQVAAPGDFLASALDADARGVLALLELQAATWAGGRPVAELLGAFERAGASAFACKVRECL